MTEKDPLSPPPRTRTASILIIGNEILSGKIQESNLLKLARLLRSMGIDLQRAVIELDDLTAIAREVAALASIYDYVFTSGGVGPTHDDVTLDAVAAAFGVPLVTEPTLEALLRKHYGTAFRSGHLRLARVPRGARMLATDDMPWPVTVMRNVWILPGIPEVFRSKLPIIRAHLEGGRPFLTRAVYTQMDEAELHPLLDTVVARHPGVAVGSYPTWSDTRYKTKITFDAKCLEDIERAVRVFLRLLPQGEPQWVE